MLQIICYKIKIWDVINLCNETNYCCEINKKTKKLVIKKLNLQKIINIIAKFTLKIKILKYHPN